MNRIEASPIIFVVPGDLHLTKPGLENHRVALHVVDEINQLIRPDFVQFIGDNVQNAEVEEFTLFRNLTDQLRVPWYALVGDHDVHADPEASRFRRRVGEVHGRTIIRDVRFLRLNTQEARPVGLLSEQLDWLETEIACAQHRQQAIVLFQHNYPYQIWEDFAGPGIDRWRTLVQTARVTAIFTGHTHYRQIANDGRNVCVASRSIGDPEGEPPGYTIGYLEGENLAVTYRSIEDRGSIVLITHPRETILATGPAHVISGRDKIQVRIWSAQPVAGVRGCIDEGAWIDLQQVAPLDWSANLPGETLAKGEHRLTVEARNREGQLTGQTIEFPVDPTGRYTAIPCVRPKVNSTKFC